MTGSNRCMRVSVVLCTFNGERYLPQQLESLLSQTRVPEQIVILDDLSGDNTWTILERFADRAASRGIAVVLRRNTQNLGYVRNFESALNLADGEVIFLCDQDDVWNSTKVERITAEFEARPSLRLIHTDAELVDENGISIGCGLFEALELSRRELNDVHENRAFDVLIRRSIATGATMAIRRGLLDTALPFPDHWVHDEWLAVVASLLRGMDCLESRFIDYRQHASNQIGVSSRGFIDKVRGSGCSRRIYMRRIAIRFQCLLDRARAGGIEISNLNRVQLQQRIEHAQVRADLSVAFASRILPVLKELRTGRYGLYSSGWHSVVSDLLDLHKGTAQDA